MAKQRGYRSRAVFKLRHVIDKYGLITRGDKVIDIGAAPGGWIQTARQASGTQGFVLGIDINRIPPLNFQNVLTVQADVLESTIFDHIREVFPFQADVVISDISPNISGAWDVDHGRQIQLAERSLEIAKCFLRPRGKFFVKAFQGSELEQFRRIIVDCFGTVKYVKPPASRPRSAEIYILASDFRGTQ